MRFAPGVFNSPNTGNTTGGAELAASTGLFVHSVAEGTARSFYAVTSVVNGVEDRRLRSGVNTSASSVLENAAPPEPVLQTSDPLTQGVGIDAMRSRTASSSPWSGRRLTVAWHRRW